MSTHKNWAQAYCAAWAEFPAIVKDGTNPHFKSEFATLPGLLKATRPALAKHGLAPFWDTEIASDGWTCVKCYLIFGDGETPEDRCGPPGRAYVPSGETAQKQGASNTYGRRYSFENALGICGSDDDDGNTAETAPKRGKPKTQKEAAARTQKQKESGIGPDGLPLGWKEEKTGHFGATGQYSGWTWRQLVSGKNGDNPCEPGGERWKWMNKELEASQPDSNLKKMLTVVSVAIERAIDQKAAEEERGI
jgi:hypothetical protein